MEDIDKYLKEDLGEEGDVTSDSLFTKEKAKAHIFAKEQCVVAGLKEAKKVFERTGSETKLFQNDGEVVKEKTIVAEIKGPIRSILKGERLALNFISRMSGIATETRKLVDICRAINPKVEIAATRKTTPGFRKYEKKSVVLGGGEAHRFGLFDAILIKDNHIKGIGSVEKAITTLKQKAQDKIIEIEVETEEDAIAAAELSVDVIMLDNFNPKLAEVVSREIRKINSSTLIEISGGVTPNNITKYASFADRISLGYLTHSVKSLNFSLEIM
jgi:nicotinate-nucleotide pyrophosphorylase (carboxylating)